MLGKSKSSPSSSTLHLLGRPQWENDEDVKVRGAEEFAC